MKNWLLKKLLGKGTLRLAWRMVRDHDLPFDQALGRAVAAIYQEGSREAFEREKGRPRINLRRRRGRCISRECSRGCCDVVGPSSSGRHSAPPQAPSLRRGKLF